MRNLRCPDRSHGTQWNGRFNVNECSLGRLRTTASNNNVSKIRVSKEDRRSHSNRPWQYRVGQQRKNEHTEPFSCINSQNFKNRTTKNQTSLHSSFRDSPHTMKHYSRSDLRATGLTRKQRRILEVSIENNRISSVVFCRRSFPLSHST
jgi:hypothetical protein